MKRYSIYALIIVMVISLCTACKSDSEKSQSTEQYLSNDLVTDSYYLYSADGTKTEYLDFDTMESSLYCNTPNCTHTDSNCMAGWFGGKMPIVYNNSVFYFVSGSDELYDSDNNGREDKLKIESKLMKYDMEQKTTETFLTWEGSRGESLLGAYVYKNMLYFIGERSYVEFAELPGLETPDAIPRQTLLYKVNLDNGELKEFENFYDDDLKIRASYDSRGMRMAGKSENKLWFVYSYVSDENLSGDKIDNYVNLCFTLNLENDEICLEDEPAPELILNEYRCHTENDGTAVIYKDDKTWSFQAEKWDFFSNNLSLADDKVWHLGNGDSWYYDLKSEEMISVSLFSDIETSVQVISKYKDFYICKYEKDGKFVFEKVEEKELSGGENN